MCSLTPLVRPSFDGRLTHIAECNWLKCAVACNSTVHMHVQCMSGTHSEWSAVRLLLCYTFFLTLRWERSGFFFFHPLWIESISFAANCRSVLSRVNFFGCLLLAGRFSGAQCTHSHTGNIYLFWLFYGMAGYTRTFRRIELRSRAHIRLHCKCNVIEG